MVLFVEVIRSSARGASVVVLDASTTVLVTATSRDPIEPVAVDVCKSFCASVDDAPLLSVVTPRVFGSCTKLFAASCNSGMKTPLSRALTVVSVALAGVTEPLVVVSELTVVNSIVLVLGAKVVVVFGASGKSDFDTADASASIVMGLMTPYSFPLIPETKGADVEPTVSSVELDGLASVVELEACGAVLGVGVVVVGSLDPLLTTSALVVLVSGFLGSPIVVGGSEELTTSACAVLDRDVDVWASSILGVTLSEAVDRSECCVFVVGGSLDALVGIGDSVVVLVGLASSASLVEASIAIGEIDVTISDFLSIESVEFDV